MCVDLKDDPKRVLDVNHLERFVAGIVFADRHPLLAPMDDDLRDQILNVGILDSEVKGPGFPVVELCGLFVVLKFEHFDPNLIPGRQMSDSE